MLKALIAVLVGLFLVSIAGVLIPPTPTAGSIHMEIAKALLQLGVVAVAGTVVSVLVFEYQRERQNQDKTRELDRKGLEYREELLKAVLSRAMACYSQSKKARRLLRARALEHHDGLTIVLANQYDQYMDLINDAQLELENLARDVQNSAPAFSSADTIVKHLRSMEKYLSKIIGEYEKNRGLSTMADGKLTLEEFPVLNEYLKTASESPFTPNVIFPYHEVQLAIRKDLLHPHLPGAK